MNSDFILLNKTYQTNDYIYKMLINFPRSEKILRDKINDTSFEILELVYFSNLLETHERIIYQKKIISKIKMLDFYFKIACDKKYISYKKYMKLGSFLLNMIKQIHGWIRYEKGK